MEKFGFTQARNVTFKRKIAINCTHRFFTDDEELTGQSSSVRQCFRLLHTFMSNN